MSMFEHLPHGIAIVGRTGSGKSTIFFASEYVLDVILTDTGSAGHRLYHRGGGTLKDIDPHEMDVDPIEQTRLHVTLCESESRLWVLDSWTSLEAAMCAWWKFKHKLHALSQRDHMTIIGKLRDLAFTLSRSKGFTLFNTGQGGPLRDEQGRVIGRAPPGVLTGYPSLSGTSPGTESILSKWSSVWIAFPGWSKHDENGRIVKYMPRGFLLEASDPRPQESKDHTPLKDPLKILAAGSPVQMGDHTITPETMPFSTDGTATIDVMLRLISDKWGPKKKLKKKPAPNGFDAKPLAPDSETDNA